MKSIKISEILDDKDDEEEEKDADTKSDEAEKKLSPRAQEGLQILADLVDLSR